MDVVVRKKPLLGFARTYRDIFLVCSITWMDRGHPVDTVEGIPGIA